MRLRARIPWPWSAADRSAGYDWALSIWQIETSLTRVFDQPRHGREFFESIIRDNLDLDRPERVALVVDRRIHTKVPCVVDGRFGAQSAALLEVLFDGAVLLADVQARVNVTREDARGELARGASGDPKPVTTAQIYFHQSKLESSNLRQEYSTSWIRRLDSLHLLHAFL